MTNELAVRNTSIISTYDEVERVAKAMAASGFFPDAQSISKAVVKIMAGAEIGFGPFASMQGVNIIKGKPSYNANMMASSVKASEKYDYRIVSLTDDKCDLLFFENGQEAGHSVFTIQDARKAGVSNLDKFPRNMLFARAMSNGVRWYCPDVTNGNAVYTPEELGAEVDEDGNVIDGTYSVPEQVEQPEPEPDQVEDAIKDAGPEAVDEPMTIERAAKITDSKGTPYIEIDSDTLSKKTIGIDKGLKKKDLTNEEREFYQEKLDAIQIILKNRADGTIQYP
jgi:hypothetical protein